MLNMTPGQSIRFFSHQTRHDIRSALEHALAGRVPPPPPFQYIGTSSHKRRIYTEEKVKVVAAVFLAALDVVHPDDLKKRTNCTRI